MTSEKSYRRGEKEKGHEGRKERKKEKDVPMKNIHVFDCCLFGKTLAKREKEKKKKKEKKVEKKNNPGFLNRAGWGFYTTCFGHFFQEDVREGFNSEGFMHRLLKSPDVCYGKRKVGKKQWGLLKEKTARQRLVGRRK